MKSSSFLFIFLGCCFFGFSQVGVFGRLGQIGIEAVSVFGNQLVLNGSVWHAAANQRSRLYLSENTSIVAVSADAYLEVTIQAQNPKILFIPLGYFGIHIPLTLTGLDTASLIIGLEPLYLSKFIFHRPVKEFLPFAWQLVSEGSFQFHIPLESYARWLKRGSNCFWIGKKESRWELLPTRYTSNHSLELSESLSLSSYTALSVVSFWEEKPLQIAQALTPNGDGINDTWILTPIDQYPTASIRVYNQRGNLVYTSLGLYQNDWEGTHSVTGSVLANGVYQYEIRLYGGMMDSPVLRGRLLLKSD